MEKYIPQKAKAKSVNLAFLSVFVLLFLLGQQQANSQTPFTVNWPLSTNLTAATTGNVVAQNASNPVYVAGTGGIFGTTTAHTFSSAGLTGTGIFGRATTTAVATYNAVGATSPITPFIEFVASPSPGSNMTVNSLSFSVSSPNVTTSGRVLAAGYSVDGGATFTGFTPSTTSSGATANAGPSASLFSITAANVFTFSLPASVNVANGSSLIIRVLIWRNNASNSSGSVFTISPVTISGTTSFLPATVTTVTPSNIGATTATSGGSSFNSGGSVLSGKGVVWSTTANPTLANSSLDAGTGLTDFSSAITGLIPETVYNVRAYATNEGGTFYGLNESFKTLSAAPTSATSSNTATGFSQTAINLAWTAASFPTANATARGYVLLRALHPEIPSLANGNGAAATPSSNTTIVGTAAGNAVSFQATGLLAFTRYNFVIVPFTWDGVNANTYHYNTTSLPVFDGTSLAGPPSVSTVPLTAITHNSVTTGGSAVNNGGGVLTGKGVVWGTSINPTITDNRLDAGTVTSSFTSVVTTLSPQTFYHIRAYATNNSGTQYGSNLTFRTLSAPVTAQASNLRAAGNNSSTTRLDFTWTAASFPTSGATNTGYLLLYAAAPNVPVFASLNAQAPIAGANTTLLSSSIAGNANSFSSTNLANSENYNFLLIPYTWDGTNPETYNYLTAAAPTASSLKLPLISGRNSLCMGEQITLSSNSATGNTWSRNGVVIAGATGQQLLVNSGGSYTVSVNWGSASSVSVPMVVSAFALPVPGISSSNGLKISKGDRTQLTARDGVTYLWSPNIFKWIDNVNIANPTVKPDVTTTFSVTVTNANGCSSTENITIEVESDFKVTPQTLITPNGDGKNDFWIIKNIDAYPDNEVKVFDASGRQVYRKQRYNNSWDGTFNGSPLPTGTYTFIIYFGEKIALVKGYLTILK